MEFQTLILQINELEENNRAERAKLIEEVGFHQATKAELEKCRAELLKCKEENVVLREHIVGIETQRENEEKIIEQLKLEVKDAKSENSLLKDSVEKELRLLRQKREWFIATIDSINSQIRTSHEKIRKVTSNKGHFDFTKESTNSIPITSKEDQSTQTEAPLQQEQSVQTDIIQETKPIELDDMAVDLNDEPCKETKMLKEEIQKLHEEEQNYKKQLEFLASREQHMVAQVTEREQEIEQMTKEFRELDGYTNLLQQHLEDAKKVIEQQVCSRCGETEMHQE